MRLASSFVLRTKLLHCLAALVLLTALIPIDNPAHAQELIQTKEWIRTGKSLIEDGDYEKALTRLKEGLKQTGTDNQNKFEIYHSLCPLLIYVDRVEEAELCSRRALALALSNNDQVQTALFTAETELLECYGQALAMRKTGDISGSNLKFREAYQNAGSPGSQAYKLRIAAVWSVNYLGSINSRGQYLNLNTEALNLALVLNYKTEACRASTNIGSYYAMISDYSHALSYYHRALYYIRNRRPNSDVIRILNNVAGIYISLGDYVKAYDYLSESLKYSKEIKREPIQKSILMNLGRLFLTQARSTQSIEDYKRAQECFSSFLEDRQIGDSSKLYLDAVAGLSSVLADQGQLNEAESHIAKALEDIMRTNASIPLNGSLLGTRAAIAFRKKKVNEAEQYYQEALSLGFQSRDPLLMIIGSCGQGQCALFRQDYAKAIESFNSAIKIVGEYFSIIVNDTNRADFISKYREPYAVLIDLYATLSRGNNKLLEHEAFRLSEYFRARSFIEFQERLVQRDAGASPSSSGYSLAELDNDRIALIRSLSQQTSGNAQYAELQSKLMHIDDMADSALFSKFLQNSKPDSFIQPISLGALQSSMLDGRTALIEYFLGDKRSFVFCITKGSFNLIELPSAQYIYDSLIAYLRFLEDPSKTPSKGIPAAIRLYNTLLLPITHLIPNSIDHLIIVPDGILFRLPFESLAIQDPGSSVIEHVNDIFTVSYSPSASALFWLNRRPRVLYSKDLLALGISSYKQASTHKGQSGSLSAGSILNDLYKRSGFNLEPVPHVESELAGLKRRFLPERIDTLYGDDATEKALRNLDLAVYRLIHLACHAFSDENYPMRSSLMLAATADDEEDGFLQVSEMYSMRTNADLVILSACNTGTGKISRNEGLLGMPRVFFYMGARSVISTLWPVNDKASALFMKYFYDMYLAGFSKAKSLQAAKQKMARSRFAHPFYWATYVLTGEY